VNCELCGRPLPTGIRRSRRFCSDRCRKRAARGQPPPSMLSVEAEPPGRPRDGSDGLVSVVAELRGELSDRPPADTEADRALGRLRDALWDSFDGETGSAKASLGRELRMVLAAIEARRAAVAAAQPPPLSMVDHLRARRVARLAGRPMPECPPELHCRHGDEGAS
jgi:hypothetical protein